MNFLFSLVRIKGLCMFRALLAHPQEVLHKRHLVYCMKLQSWHSQMTLYARNIPSAVCTTPPEDEQVMLKTCRGSWFSINWMKSASRWFRYADTLWCTVSKTLRIFWSAEILNLMSLPVGYRLGKLLSNFQKLYKVGRLYRPGMHKFRAPGCRGEYIYFFYGCV
jgi:hypothetical protein